MTPLRHHMIAALPLRGQGERTQEASGREVRLLSECSSSSPARIAAPALQQSFRPRKHGDTLAPNSLRIGSRGLRFFSPPVLTRDWHPLALLRAATARRLPTVLRVPEVRRLLNAAPPLHHQVSFTTLSSVGLRLPAGLCLQGGAIDSQRMLDGAWEDAFPRLSKGCGKRHSPHDTCNNACSTSWGNSIKMK
jgi:hypothetical protein